MTPLRYQLSKRTFWLDLPLTGLLVGGLVAAGRLWGAMGATNTLSFVDTTFCDLAIAAIVAEVTVDLAIGCDVTAVALASSPVTTTADTLQEGLAVFPAVAYYDYLRYPVAVPPPFQTRAVITDSASLMQIIDGAVDLITAQGLPTASVSMSLVDLTGDCCDYAAYQDQQPRYPASIVKLFWLVALYGHYDAGQLQPAIDIYPEDEILMSHYSNNGASSRVVDALTQTVSGENLSPAELQAWIDARTRLNDYFLLAQYPDLNIAHKTFPIPDLDMPARTGRELQFAHGEPDTVSSARQRNYLTTAAVARLLYEIDAGQAISPEFSDRIKQHLSHSTNPAVWQWEEPNAIAGFFGEYLPPDAELYTKLGFTFDDGRQEAAIIASPDQQVRFALVIFANDPAFSGDATILPTVARYIYDQMHQR
ncbi:MAG: serine hydrolase, partial [Cyanobacteria bacterium P01_H01_bin.162]